MSLLAKRDIEYAQSGAATIAFQVTGEGPPLVWVPGFISHVDMNWESPFYRHGLERVSRFARVATFDKRGTGLSDRSVDFGSLEERMDDIRAVMDAAGFARCVLCGFSEGGPLSILFAATYPERVEKLVVYGSYARLAWAPDYPIGRPDEAAAAFASGVQAQWGTGNVLRHFAQHAPDLDSELRVMSRLERYTATPEMAARIMRHNQLIDVREALPLVSAPSLVIHAAQDPVLSVAHGRYLAERLPNCRRYVELEGDFHVSWRDEHHDLVVDPIEEFVTGQVTRPGDSTERFLTTILFTDIVDSTARAQALGDAAWRSLLDAHDVAATEEVARFRGRLVKFTGDGILVCFDGPARAVRCAQSLVARTRALGLEIRAGVHTGECEARGEDLAGIAVHVAARIMLFAQPHEVITTRTVKDLVDGSGLIFQDRGLQSFKGVRNEIQVFATTL